MIPSKKHVSLFNSHLFSTACVFFVMSSLKFWGLREVLRDKYKLVDEEASSLADFLNSLLEVSGASLHCIVLHCIALYWIGLGWIGLDFIGLDCIVLDCIVLDCIVLYSIVLCCIVKLWSCFSMQRSSCALGCCTLLVVRSLLSIISFFDISNH